MKFHTRLAETLSLGYLFFKAGCQLMYGYWRVMSLAQPCISIFGGSRITPDNNYSRMTFYIASELTKADISILTGGGPGIMEAATCGAAQGRPGQARSMGISSDRLIKTEPPNACVGKSSLVVSLYLTRKWLLIYYSIGFVILPGGVGTLDEFATLLLLIDIEERMAAPIILLGQEFWQPFVDWLDASMQSGLVKKETRDLVIITDDPDYAIKVLKDYCRTCAGRGLV